MADFKQFYILLFIASLTLQVLAAPSKVYSWRNADGILVFSDSPKPGSQEIKIKQANVFSPATKISNFNTTSKVIQQKYQIKITQPANNSTIRDNTGLVQVEGKINHPFKQTHKVVLILDGKIFQKSHSSPSFILHNIERGEHIIKMDLKSDKGKVIASSSPVTFYMHRSSIIKAN